MEIIPAIDLRGGKCVRLLQGDFARETVFSDDPARTALQWQSLGAKRLHVVDLDGAREGSPQNTASIRTIVGSVQIPVQVGGGIRTLGDIEKLLSLRVARAILGTVAIEQPDLTRTACKRFGEHVAIGVDARNGFVAIHGWQEATATPAAELVAELAGLGARRIIYTDISRDGTLTEPNFEAYRTLKGITSLPIIASGGIAGIEHLRRLRDIGVEAAIVGRALYTGDLKLEEAIKALHSA